MPFCRHCGSKTGTGQKFCEECGAPVVTARPAPPPPPAQPPAAGAADQPTMPGQAAPVPDQKGLPSGARPPSAGTILVIVLGIALIAGAAAWYAGMPLMKGIAAPGTGHAVTATVPATSPVTTSMVTRTTAPAITTHPTPAAVMTVEDRYAETYEVIYTSDRSYQYGEKVTFPYTLSQPPLYIKFNVTPAMVNDTKIADIGFSSEHVVYAVYPDPHAWFEVKVLDAENGAVVDSRGFGIGKNYSNQNRQEFMVRKSGNYTIELSGNMVNVITEIRKGTT